MFVIDITFTADQEEIDKKRLAHRNYLARQVELGNILCFGPKIPLGTGGVVLCNTIDKKYIQNLISNDPYSVNNIAIYEVFEFSPLCSVPELEAIIKE